MARILNASPVAIALARLAAQVREHAPYCGPERTYTVALRDLGRACGLGDDFERGEDMSDHLWHAVSCAFFCELLRPTSDPADPIMLDAERCALAYLMTSPEWHAWIAQRGPCADADLTPEARAENEWKRNMADARVRNVTSLT